MKFGEKPQTESNPSCVLIFYQQVDQPSQEDVDKVNCFRKYFNTFEKNYFN